MNSANAKLLQRQGDLWMVASLVFAMTPQLMSMPGHLIPITMLPVAWRLLAEFRDWKPMPMVLRVLATGFAVAALVMTYGGLMGRRAAVSMLVLMLSLKLLETFSTRDARVVASLSLFLCATQFLFSQGLAMMVYIVVCLLSSLVAMMYLQRREAFQNIAIVPETGRGIFSELGFGMRLMLLALPVGLAFFLLFPRWGSPLWGVPENALDARSGLSDSMTPGSIQGLFMDDSPAFRAEFETSIPGNSDLYWRGPVFWDFDGRTWASSYLSKNLPAETKPEPLSAPFRYEVQMEPTEQHWLFALDYPALRPQGARMTVDYQLITAKPITSLRSYVMASDPGFRDSPKLKQTLRKAALELPAGFNPRTAALIAGWRAETKSDSAMVQRVLAFFNQENFHYTLNPALLSRHTVDEFVFDTQEGFCEHYASAFTIMMRMAGIPARVVTGYQGGWYSSLGSYVLVRQSDAHAWSEVWIRGSGWTRIDPTAAVAPQRVNNGSVNSLAERRHLLDFAWLRDARNTFDLLQRSWNSWVIAFDASKQSNLFSGLGWGFWDSTKLIIALIAAIVVSTTAVILLLPLILKFRSSRNQDPLLRLWQKFTKKLTKAGFVSHPAMSPRELGSLARSQLKHADDGINQIVELYLLCRYSGFDCNQSRLAELINNFHPQQETT